MEHRTAKVLSLTSSPGTPPLGMTRVRLWDRPIRFFHWTLALLVLAAFVTANVGGPWMVWHGRAGLAIVGLLVFRVVWGIAGSHHARFASFVPTPGRVRAYLGGRWQGLGHNPLGALSVFGLLGLLAVQTGTGLLANDDIDFEGPLSSLVEKARSDSLTGLHHQLSNVLLALIALHIVAVVFYLVFKKKNLVKPMLTGYQDVPSGQAPRHLRTGSAAVFAVALAAALGAVWVASGGALHHDVVEPAPVPAPAAPTTGTASVPPTGSPSW
jgi:cytochrome b